MAASQQPALDFTGAKGLHTDSLPVNQPVHTYAYGRNITHRLDLVRESCRLPDLSHELPGDALGLLPLNGQTIVFYRATNGKDGVGVLTMRSSPTGTDTWLKVWETDLLALAGRVKMRGRLDYRGHRIVYFTDGVGPVRKLDLDGILDGSNVPVEADDLNLILQNPLPDLTDWKVLDGGVLAAGMYQVMARLLTISKVGTPFNVGTPLIPLSARPSSAPWPQQDGGLERPGAEQISVTVSSIAPGFRYVQLAVVFYDPYTLTPDVRLQEPVEIAPDQTEATLLVTKLPDTSITLAQLTTEALNVKTAQLIDIAKDSLLLTDVSVQREDGFDWQGVANQVALYWTVKKLTNVFPRPTVANKAETSSNAGVVPLYYDTTTAAELRSHQRNEVYSFALSPIIEGERTQSAFPIPAGVATGANALAVWTSQERYPFGRGFPVDAGTTRPAYIRHHKMPSLQDAPLTDNSAPFNFDGTISAINVLGVRAVLPSNLAALIPEAMRKRLKGFRILRQPRPVEQSTILASGLVQTMINGEQVLYPSPSSGAYHENGGVTGWSSQADENDYTTADHEYKIEKKRWAFYSLDTLMGGVDATQAQQVYLAAMLKGRAWLVDSERTNGDDNDEGHKFMFTFVNVTQVDAPALAMMGQRSYPLDQSITQVIGAGDQYAGDINVGDVAGSYSVRNQNGYLLLGLDNTSGSYGSGFPVQFLRKEFVYSNRTDRTDEIFGFTDESTNYNQDDLGSRVVPSARYLAQLTRSLPGQYGRIEQATYFAVGSIEATASASATVYRGDVFVQPCGLLLASQERRYNYDKKETNVNGPYTRQLVWFTCESRVNAGRRHFDAPKGGNVGTLPYYPLLKNFVNDAGTGLLQLPVNGGHAVGYNKSYSLEEKVTTFFPRLLSTAAIVDRFRNRTYYSADLVEGALTDAWQTFRADNYYDLPATRGYITDIFTQGGVLYQRTSMTLYRAFFKETTFSPTSSGQALLGTGLAFSQPSVEVRVADDGFGGGQLAGSSDTVAGRVLVDAEREQLFVFSSDFQELLRANGCVGAFRDLLATGPITAGAYSPDPECKSFFLFTATAGLSYSLAGEQFLGSHDFGADMACTTSRHVILAQGKQLLNLSFGPRAANSEAWLVGVAGGGDDGAVYFAGQMQVEPLPKTVTVGTPTQALQAHGVRLHGGLRDINRDGDLVAQRFDAHYNLGLPFVAADHSRFSGMLLYLRVKWAAPMVWRKIRVLFQPKGV